MLKGMHKDEATASNGVEESDTAARRRWKNGLAEPRKNEDALIAYLGVLVDEELERLREEEPNKKLEFPHSSVAAGRYSIILLAEVPLELKQLRMKLAAWIICAWIYCRWDEAEEFAEALRRWPIIEDKEVAKILRERIDDTSHLLTNKISKFFRWADVPTGPNEIYRTMFKAMARQMTMEEIVCLGAGLSILQDNSNSLGTVFRDFIRNANRR